MKEAGDAVHSTFRSVRRLIFVFASGVTVSLFADPVNQHLREVRDRIVSRDYRTDFNTLVLGEFFDKKRIREAEKSWTAIPRKDLRVSQHDGRCRLTDPNGVPLNGLCNLELQDNFFFAGEFRDGMMDGIAVGYCGWPYPRYFAMGRYRNGVPYHGSMFLFLREDLIVTHWLLHYENGVFHEGSRGERLAFNR